MNSSFSNMINIYKDNTVLMFNRQIVISQSQDGSWTLRSDRGDLYQMLLMKHTQSRTLITDWWALNYPSELRRWQMDLLLKETTRMGYGEDFILWVPYKKGQGYQQLHNIMIFYHCLHSMWILSLGDHHWFQYGPLAHTEFNLTDSIEANILDYEDRKNILYPIVTELNQAYRSKHLEKTN